jgi:hypothetical protein
MNMFTNMIDLQFNYQIITLVRQNELYSKFIRRVNLVRTAYKTSIEKYETGIVNLLVNLNPYKLFLLFHEQSHRIGHLPG